jgi:uncharacterized protein YmfQ (DUF2313 family)
VSTVPQLTLGEHVRAIAQYLPPGRAHGAKDVPGSVTHQLLTGLAAELVRSAALMEEFRDNVLPDSTVLLLDEWERALGIPDRCFSGTGTDTERRRDVLAKLVSFGVQTAEDFIRLANLFGITVSVVYSGAVFGTFPFTFPIVLFPNPAAARHTLVIDVDLPVGLVFPYTFPLPFGNPSTVLLECLFRQLKPANVDLVFVNL